MKAKQLKQQADPDPLLATKSEGKTANWAGASPADYPLGSTQSRAIARAWVEAKSPRNREELQRDEDALLLYQMKYELHGPVYPDYSIVEQLPIFVHANELRLQKYGPIIPAHEWPAPWKEWTEASREFRRCFGRDPKAGDLLRWEHVRVMRGAESYEQEVLPQIAAWERQIQNLSCPLKFENGRLFKRNRRGEWFEEISVKWQYHWIQIQTDAGVAVERTSELLMHRWLWQEASAISDELLDCELNSVLEQVPDLALATSGPGEELTYDDLDLFLEHCQRIIAVHSIRIDLSPPGASTTSLR